MNINKKAKLHILSHTHWDREWYQDFQGYRQRLVYQLDNLLNLLESQPDYRCFHLDGQVACLLDYLEIRPENKARMEKYIKSNRIAIGPWFVMPDELLLSGESLVRNLMLGHNICNMYGVKPMPVGYVTDIFGHCSQFPQILKGFGIECAFLHRGTSGEDEYSEMAWEGADGSKIMLIKVYQFTGYNDILSFKWVTDESLRAYANEYEKNKFKLATTDILFGLDGNDHTTPRWDIPDEIARLNNVFDNIECIHSSFSEYYDALKSALGNDWSERLKTYKGELRTASKQGTWNELMNGTGSSRLPLKKANDELERLIARYAEPLNAWNCIVNGDDQKAFIELSWKYLLLNHPHDSIVGCSIDQVHRDMMYRFDQAKSLALNSIRESIQTICETIDGTTMDGCTRIVNVFNLSNVATGPVLRFSFEIPSWLVQDMENKGLMLEILDVCGKPLEYKILSIEKNVRTEFLTKKVKSPYPSYSVVPDINVHRYNIAMEGTIPPLSRKAWGIRYAVETVFTSSKLHPIIVDESSAEMNNGLINVKILDDGRIDLHDLESDVLYSGLLYYEDCGDVGEGWNHFYPEKDDKILSTDNSSWRITDIELLECNCLTASFKISGLLNIPEDLDETRKGRSENKIEINIETIISLTAGKKRLECKTLLRNTACCHRVRAMFPTGQKSDFWFADTAFDVVKRNVIISDTSGWKEQARPESPIKNFAGLRGETGGLAVITKGLCEACVLDDAQRTIALTLFRSFSENLLEEWTKDSLLLTELTVEYSILPLTVAPEAQDADLFVETEHYKYPLIAYTMPAQAGSIKSEQQLIKVGFPFVLSSIKTSENGVVVRIFNPYDIESASIIQPNFSFQEAWETDLLENGLKKLENKNNAIEVTLRGKQVYTILFSALI